MWLLFHKLSHEWNIHIFISRVKFKPYSTEIFEFSFYYKQCLVQSDEEKHNNECYFAILILFKK